MSKPFYTLEETIRDLDTIKQLGFHVLPGFWLLTPEQVQAISNGSGPSSWSNSERHFLTGCETEGARLAAIVHDVCYCCPDKSPEMFHHVNLDFFLNQALWSHHAYAGNFMARGAADIEARIEYKAVEIGGWDAWITGETLDELDPEEGPEVMNVRG